MTGPVEISFLRTGGIAGISWAASVLTDELDDQGSMIVAELWSGRLSAPQQPDQGAGGGADRFEYLLGLQRGETRQTFRWSEEAVPQQVRPLISELSRRAAPQ